MVAAVGIIFLGAILFSAKAVLVKLTMPYGIDAVPLLALRMLFSLPFNIAVLIAITAGEPKPTSKMPWLRVIGLGIVGYYLASYFDFLGLEYISASLERVILYSYPTMVLVLSAIFLGRKVNLPQIIAVALCYAGIFVAIWFGPSAQVQGNLASGVTLIFLSALTYAIYLIGSGELIPKIGVWRFTAWAMITSTVCIVIHFLVIHPPFQLLGYPRQVYYAAAMALFATVIPSFLISEGIKRIGASNAAIIGGIGPVSTIVLASIFLGEKFTLAQVLGTLLVIAGVVYLSVKGKPREPQVAQMRTESGKIVTTGARDD